MTTFSGILEVPHRYAQEPPVKLENTGVTSQKSQKEFWDKRHLLKDSIAAKLRGGGHHSIADILDDCATRQSHAECTGCRKVRTFYNHCDNWFCPVCQPTLSKERKRSIEWWTNEITQPKHVVLTQRNTAVMTWDTIKQAKTRLTKLRRSKFAKHWRGGMWSLEITNEGKGWHIHFHLLVDANWIDEQQLAIKWGKLTGQDFAIVKVKDCRNKTYLQEVTKYAVKGQQMAKWSSFDIACIIHALNKQRTFGVFGSLYGKRTLWKTWLDSIREHGMACECGCVKWKIYDELEWRWREETASPVFSARPPPATTPYEPQAAFNI